MCPGGSYFLMILSLRTLFKAGVAFYALCRELNFQLLEEKLAKTPSVKLHPQMVFNHLLEEFKGPTFGWSPISDTTSNVCLVLDEIGPYPKCARAVCKMMSTIGNVSDSLRAESKNEVPETSTSEKEEPHVDEETSRTNDAELSHRTPELDETTAAAETKHDQTGPVFNVLLKGLETHFKTTGRVVIFAVGTGVESAFTKVPRDSMPESCKHRRVEAFEGLRSLYEKSRLWKAIIEHVPKELNSGVFARLSRLAKNPRMAALLASLDTTGAEEAVGSKTTTVPAIARSPGAKASYLRAFATHVVSNGAVFIRAYGGLAKVAPLTATTWFGAAFALACSNETQNDKANDTSGKEHPCITALRTEYGLMSDLMIEGDSPKTLTHRFGVTSAAVELGFSGFGMSPQQEGWRGFEHKIADTFTLHTFGAGCAGKFNIILPPSVKSENAPEVDPLVPIKDYLRKHAYTARSVTRVQLKSQVTSYCDAATTLEKHALDVRGAADQEPCVVVALNGDKAPFADIVVGVLTVDGGRFRTTHLMLVKLKLYTKTKLSVLQQWEEMRKMGSTEREAVIAGCVTELAESWDDAMEPLTSAARHRREFDAVRTKFHAKHKGEDKRTFVPKPSTRNTVFADLCSDGKVMPRDPTPYAKALESYTRVGQRNFAATLANYLHTRKPATRKGSRKDAKILRATNKIVAG